MTTHVVVDAANVVGSRADGWWRDRPAAARRLAGELVAALTESPDVLAEALGVTGDLRVQLVLEGAGRVPDLPTSPHLVVHRAPADGDATIAAVAAGLAAGPGDHVIVVTADRELRERVRAVGAAVTGPSTLLGAVAPRPTDR